MLEVGILQAPKRQEKCGNSASNHYWRSVEDNNGVLLEACGGTCNRINFVVTWRYGIFKCILYLTATFNAYKWYNYNDKTDHKHVKVCAILFV